MNNFREVDIISHSSGKNWRDFLSLVGVSSPGGIATGTLTAVRQEVKLTLSEESYNYSIRNATTQPFKELYEKINNGLVGGVLAGLQTVQAAMGREAPSFNPWFKYAQAWTNTEPVQIPLKFDFKMGQFGLWNAQEEVAKPILALIIPAIPKSVSNLYMSGPFQSATELLAKVMVGVLTAVGEAIKDLIGTDSEMTTLAEKMSAVMIDSIKASTYKIIIGNQFELNHAYCREASVSLSTATDQFGFPISGSVMLTYEGSIPPALTNSLGVSGTRFYAAK